MCVCQCRPDEATPGCGHLAPVARSRRRLVLRQYTRSSLYLGHRAGGVSQPFQTRLLLPAPVWSPHLHSSRQHEQFSWHLSSAQRLMLARRVGACDQFRRSHPARPALLRALATKSGRRCAAPRSLARVPPPSCDTAGARLRRTMSSLLADDRRALLLARGLGSRPRHAIIQWHLLLYTTRARRDKTLGRRLRRSEACSRCASDAASASRAAGEPQKGKSVQTFAIAARGQWRAARASTTSMAGITTSSVRMPHWVHRPQSVSTARARCRSGRRLRGDCPVCYGTKSSSRAKRSQR